MATVPLGVRLTADLADLKKGLGLARTEIAQLRDVSKPHAGGDLFSGLASGLKGFLAATVSIGLVVEGIRAIVEHTIEGEKAQSQLAAVLKSTGGAAGFTAGELNKMAEQMQAVSTFAAHDIIGAQTLLLQFTKIGHDVFPQATQAVLDFATRMGVDLPTAASTVGKALQDPEHGLKGLKAAGVDLSESQKELIKNLEATGQQAAAQKIILGELTTRMGGAAAAARDTLGGALKGLENDFGNVLEGDTGSAGVKGVVGSINSLAEVMRSPNVKAGFQSIVQGMASIIAEAAGGIGAIVKFGQALDQEFALGEKLNRHAAPSEFTGREIDLRLQELQNQINFARSGGGGDLEALLAERLALVRENTKRIKSELLAADLVAYSSGPNNGRGRGVNVGLLRAPAAEAAATDAINKHTAADHSGEDAATAYDAAMAEVNGTLREQAIVIGGDAVKAAFDYTDKLVKLADAERVLAKQGKLDEDAQNRIALARQQALDAYQAKLEKIADEQKVTLNDLEQRFSAIHSGFGSGANLIDAQVKAGLLSHSDGEQQMVELRAKAIEQLKALRIATLAYLQTQSGAAADAAIQKLQEIDTALAAAQAAQNEFKLAVKDQAVNALTGFFDDLITGAKSFKDAFKDMVRNFVEGVAKIIAQKLALKAVDAIFSAFGFHSGGVVGEGGASFVRNVNPMLFGAAPRFHSGGIAGLAPGEMPAILQRGEEVLTRNDPRHVANLGRGGSAPQVTKVNVFFNADDLADAMAGPAGERVVVAHVRNNGRKLGTRE